MANDDKLSNLSTAAQNTAVIKTNGEFIQRSGSESDIDESLREMFQQHGFSTGPQWAYHANAYLKRQALSRILYLDEIYRSIVSVPGVICEFGVQYGATTALLTNLRGIYEPYNHSRHIYGFDTFEGFSTVVAKDGTFSDQGDYAVPERYEEQLESLLGLHEANAPLSHITRYHLVRGDASVTVPAWIEANPHVVVSLAILDMDVFQPTRDVLEAIKPRLVKGSIVVFDEMNCPHFPGETLAALEVFGLNNLALRRHPHQPYCSWARIGD
ncbi:TylF/MycF/NovP-related O-methyltransferase [Hyphomicrobium sp. D-2]|uniref:class I SAM-dependent methyltransferase n=1 Tax=Hyphomicrobium sp. D-2 TaxID=3041621 RepID=UPI0024542AA7|nr:TylF/MycF/NovP-related O-methyltransferase [Hyphomicrobium sp. D-2]MDH4981866.1 TylF/MycF/NovP-related O-methyltransferase [Hyphomicrobium sp. D-2]